MAPGYFVDRPPSRAFGSPRKGWTMLGRLALVLLFFVEATAARASPRDAGGRWAIVGARVYPSPDEAPVDDAVVLIDRDRIVGVGRRGALTIPAGYRRFDATGRVLTAGFWNSHVHLTRPAFLNAGKTPDAVLQAELQQDFTRWGFTTIFDLASTMETAGYLRKRLAAGAVAGPRLLSVGAPFYPGGATPIYARPLYRQFGLPSAEIRSPRSAAARAAVQIRAGADGVKLFTGSIMGRREDTVHMDARAVRAIADAAHRLGKPAIAHPTDRRGLDVAVRNGVDVLAHATPLAGPWDEAYARWIASRKVALIPTLGLFEEAGDPATPVGVALQQTRMFAKAGGTVLFGTDAGFTDRFDTSGEVRLMASALGWRGLLASLTTSPARVFGDAKRGRVAEGMIADLVLLGSDPRDRPGALTDVRSVIVGGKLVYGEGRLRPARDPIGVSRRQSPVPRPRRPAR